MHTSIVCTFIICTFMYIYNVYAYVLPQGDPGFLQLRTLDLVVDLYLEIQ